MAPRMGSAQLGELGRAAMQETDDHTESERRELIKLKGRSRGDGGWKQRLSQVESRWCVRGIKDQGGKRREQGTGSKKREPRLLWGPVRSWGFGPQARRIPEDI